MSSFPVTPNSKDGTNACVYFEEVNVILRSGMIFRR